MKKSNLFMLIVPAFFVAMIVFVASCTKEGEQGPPGEDGTDGTATCTQCHNDSQELFAKVNQWEHSTHATGGTYERNYGECAICHTSQGYLGYNVSGDYDPEAEDALISNPNPVNCYTCHNIHSQYVAEDYSLTVTEPAELRNTGGQTYDYGNANLCSNCHQGRTVDPFPAVGGADIVVEDSRYGVHHGPQANTIAGMGLFEPGVYPAHPHSNIENSCTTCHMAEAYGAQAGGHTFNISYEYHGGMEVNTAGCIECHLDEDALIEDTEELQAEIEVLLADLKVLLDAAGITAEGSDSSIPGTYPAEVAGACLNYKALTEDRSLGVHNPTYMKNLLEESIALLQ